MAKQLTKKEIATRIADSILADHVINRESIIDKVDKQLTIWHKLTTKHSNYDNIKTDKGILMLTIEQKDIERMYWLNKVRSLVKKEDMQELYDECNTTQEEFGYKLKQYELDKNKT